MGFRRREKIEEKRGKKKERKYLRGKKKQRNRKG